MQGAQGNAIQGYAASVILEGEDASILLVREAADQPWRLPGLAVNGHEAVETLLREALQKRAGIAPQDLVLFDVMPQSGEDGRITLDAVYICKTHDGTPETGDRLDFFALHDLPFDMQRHSLDVINAYMRHIFL